MYYEDDLIDWGDGWEDNEDGERIPVFALDGTKSASLRKKYEEDALNTHPENIESQAENDSETSDSLDEEHVDAIEKNERSEDDDDAAAAATEADKQSIEHKSSKRESSWSDPIESDLITRLSSDPPTGPQADNDSTKRKRSSSPGVNAKRNFRLDLPLQEGNHRSYGHYNPYFASDFAYGIQNMPFEPRGHYHGRMNGPTRMQLPYHASRPWQSPLDVATPGQPFPATRWPQAQPAQPMYNTDRWQNNERAVHSYRNAGNHYRHNRQPHFHQLSRRNMY